VQAVVVGVVVLAALVALAAVVQEQAAPMA
jgi:hypothetical protein